MIKEKPTLSVGRRWCLVSKLDTQMKWLNHAQLHLPLDNTDVLLNRWQQGSTTDTPPFTDDLYHTPRMLLSSH